MPPRVRTPAKVLEGEITQPPTDEPDPVEPTPAALTKIGPLSVLMRKPNDTQIGLILRLSRAAQRNPTSESIGRLFEAFFDVAESLLVNPADAYEIEHLMSCGKVQITDISEAWGRDGEEPANRRTRRARGN